MYNLMFSIPIHEKLECVIDQILNIRSLNPNSAIVLHISENFNYHNSLISREKFERITEELGGVIINPISVRTGSYDIIQAHVENFNYVKDKVDFKFYCMCASNELFIKKGLYEHIKDYDCGFDLHNDTDLNDTWQAGIQAHKDNELNEILHEIHGRKIMGSQIEGSFYCKSLFSQISDLITRHYDWRKMRVAYAREEVYFSTIAYSLMKKENIRVLDRGMFTWVPWKRKYTMNARLREISYLINRDTQYFSVKRVERNINDCDRAYIRQLFGYYVDEVKYLDIKGYKLSLLYVLEIIKEIRLHYNVVRKGIRKAQQIILR